MRSRIVARDGAERPGPRERAVRGIEELLARGKMRRAGPGLGLQALRLARGLLHLSLDGLRLVDPERGPGRQVLEDRAERGPEQGREPFHVLEVDALAHQLADADSLEVRGEGPAIERPEPFL